MKTITKLTLAAAVAAGVSTGASAASVYGQVTAIQIMLGSTDLMADPNSSFYGMDIGGDTLTGLTLTGDMVAYTAGTHIGLSWNLTDGVRQGVNGTGGTLFTGGTIAISTSTDGGIVYTPFDTIDVSVTNIPFLAGQDGHIISCGGVPYSQCTQGFVIDDQGEGTLPGLWDQTIFGDGFDNAVGTLNLFGNTAGIFMQGGAYYVPVPAAGWLFGSALLGLAGMRRGRKFI